MSVFESIVGFFRPHEELENAADVDCPTGYIPIAVEKILYGSSLSSEAKSEIAEILIATDSNPLKKGVKSLLAFFDGDFHWPWFDEWVKKVNESGKWPKGYGWDTLSETPPEATLQSYLLSLKKQELVGLAKQHGLTGTSRLKVGELRTLLSRKIDVDQEDIQQAIESFARDSINAQRQSFVKTKTSMFAHSIQRRAYNLYRARQIHKLVKVSIYDYRIYVDSFVSEKGELETELWNQWQFNPDDFDKIPPFYPGDLGDIRTERIKRRCK